MKKYVLFASAILAFASCASDSFTGTDEAGRVAQGEKPISFGSGLNAVTRADKTGKAAADDLSGQFYVYGIKSESTDGAGAIGTGNLVYNNYVVKFTENSGMTTTSNTEGWEYVGYTLSAKEQANITDNGGAAVQTIKYWDWGASDYTFYAFSALPTDIENDYVKVDKITSVTSPKTVYDKGYTVTLTADANLDKLFFAERVNVTDKDNTVRTTDNKFGGNVTFRFHNTATKVRVAMYETIPGYKVTINSFMVDNDGANPAFDDMTDAITANFAANLQYTGKGTAGTMTVTYDATAGATQNYPIVAFTPTGGATKVLALGDNLKENVDLGVDVVNATFDKSDKSYTSVFPNEANTQNLKLKINYTLTAIAVDNATATTGETITVEGATAEIPANYLQWKPGFAYTYIFKISPNNNGQTGPGTTPAGLYPITFDAVEVIAEDGQAEYITTVSEPSITTFGVKAGSYVSGGNEYEAGSDIYATFMEGSNVKDPTLGGNGAQHVNVFIVSTPDATNFPITEASVAEAIANPASITNPVYTFNGTDTYTQVTDPAALATGTTYYKADASSRAPGSAGYVQTVAVAGTDYQVAPKLTPTNINSETTPYFTTAPAKVTTVPGEDGVNITQNALKLTGVAATTATTAYAIEYEASDAWTGTYKKVYKVIKVTAAP